MVVPKGTPNQKKKPGPKKGSRHRVKEKRAPATQPEPVDRKRAKKVALGSFIDKERALYMAAEFPDQSLVEKDGRLFCGACNKFVKFEKKSDVRQHCEGSRAKSGEANKVKHVLKLASLEEAEKKAQVLREAIAAHRERIFAESNGTESARGSTLDLDMLAERAAVLETLWEVGVPTHRLTNEHFVQLIEDSHQTLGGVRGVEDQADVVIGEISRRTREAAAGRLGVIGFDASKVNELIEALIFRCLNDEDMPVMLCIGVAAVPKSIDRESMRELIRKHLTAVGIPLANVVGAVSDSGPPNPSAMDDWNRIAHNTLTGADLENELLHWIACLMHAMSNCGKVLRKRLPKADLFMSGFKSMVNKSEASRRLWEEVTGIACPGLAEKSFWAWYDCAFTIMASYGKVQAFLTQAKARGLAKKSITKMQDSFGPLLAAEMNFVLAFGKPFHDAGFQLEGDGFCLPFVQGHISLIETASALWKHERHNHFMIASAVQTPGLSHAMAADLPGRLFSAGEAVFDQFQSAILEKMKSNHSLWRHAGLFHPGRFLVETLKGDFNQFLVKSMDFLVDLKGAKMNNVTRAGLESEVIALSREIRLRQSEIGSNPSLDNPSDLWMWWRSLKVKLPHWYGIAKILVLLQPSSAMVERFFSLLKAYTSPLQNSESHATRAARGMLIYNGKNIQKKKKDENNTR